MSEPQDYELLATGLADMARDLMAQESVQDTLDRIAAHAVKLVNGCEAAGIMTVRRGAVSALAATDVVARDSDRAQGELGEGPCFDATVQREQVYRIEDMTVAQSKWPRYGPRARALGVGSMMGFLLYTNGRDNLGALNMYSSRVSAFGDQSEHVGWVVASHAAVALSVARHAEHMDLALESSRAIGEAIGVVMSRYKVNENAAFEMIRRASQNSNVKVRELAGVITEIGELPDEP
jgi:hypothetical protein